MIYDFVTQKGKGRQVEVLLDSYFEQWFDVRKATGAQQRQGIDRVFRGLAMGQTFTVEYKADWTASSSGNAFIEVECNGGPGWALKCQARFIAYCLPRCGWIWIIPVDVLTGALPGWEAIYPTHHVHNRGYTAAGVLVPINELRDIAVQTAKVRKLCQNNGV